MDTIFSQKQHLYAMSVTFLDNYTTLEQINVLETQTSLPSPTLLHTLFSMHMGHCLCLNIIVLTQHISLLSEFSISYK